MSTTMARLVLMVLAMPHAVLGRACMHDVYNGSSFQLADCTSLDLSCPMQDSRVTPPCDNLLRPSEIAALASALGTSSESGLLQEITLRGSPLGAKGLTILAPAFAACAALQTLNLGSCRMGDAGARSLAQAVLEPSMPATLRTLRLEHNSISDDGVRSIASALKQSAAGHAADSSDETGGNAVGLLDLDLSWNGIGTRGGRYLGEALKDGGALSALRVSWNGLMDRGARAIGEGLSGHPHLKLLDLEHNAIKREGAVALAKGLRSNSVLAEIWLEHNGVPNATMREVDEALHAAPVAANEADADGPADKAYATSRAARNAGGGDDDDIEEISFDDDVEDAAEAEAEAEAEARERAEQAAAKAAASSTPCVGVDGGPWDCFEDNCPKPSLGCTDLAGLGVCANRFDDVWETGAPQGTEGMTVASLCPKACGECQ